MGGIGSWRRCRVAGRPIREVAVSIEDFHTHTWGQAELVELDIRISPGTPLLRAGLFLFKWRSPAIRVAFQGYDVMRRRYLLQNNAK